MKQEGGNIPELNGTRNENVKFGPANGSPAPQDQTWIVLRVLAILFRFQKDSYMVKLVD